MAKKQKSKSVSQQKMVPPPESLITPTDDAPIETDEFEELYGLDAALGDQYVMRAGEAPQKSWEEDIWNEAFEDLKAYRD